MRLIILLLFISFGASAQLRFRINLTEREKRLANLNHKEKYVMRAKLANRVSRWDSPPRERRILDMSYFIAASIIYNHQQRLKK